MAFTPGAPKPPGSGRKKGTRNKITQEVAERLEELGCDPIAGMALLAADHNNSPELRGRMYAELAQYLYPKRKAVEHGADGQEIVVEFRSVFDPAPSLDCAH